MYVYVYSYAPTHKYNIIIIIIVVTIIILYYHRSCPYIYSEIDQNAHVTYICCVVCPVCRRWNSENVGYTHTCTLRCYIYTARVYDCIKIL